MLSDVYGSTTDVTTDVSPRSADQRNTYNKRGRDNSNTSILPHGNSVPFTVPSNAEREEEQEEECMEQDSPAGGDGTRAGTCDEGGEKGWILLIISYVRSVQKVSEKVGVSATKQRLIQQCLVL